MSDRGESKTVKEELTSLPNTQDTAQRHTLTYIKWAGAGILLAFVILLLGASYSGFIHPAGLNAAASCPPNRHDCTGTRGRLGEGASPIFPEGPGNVSN